MERSTVKVGIGLCSYKGPDVHCFDQQFEFMHYLGRLQERSYWIQDQGSTQTFLYPKLDRIRDDDLAELKHGDPVFEFSTITVTGVSLIGQARDMIVTRALKSEMDYVLFFDDDMIFARDAFLRLWRHQLPFVGALAFTARTPITPVLYKFKKEWNFDDKGAIMDVDIEPIFYYEQDSLIQVDAIGTGFVLINTDVFKKIPKPWFHGAISCGEDVHFSFQCMKHKIPVYCDTAVKTIHRPNQQTIWHDEISYLARLEEEAVQDAVG